MPEQSQPTGAVFLSYASQDSEAAARICEALRAAGVEVWFDKSELRGGDAWDLQIKKQIHDCALFVPLISSNTNSRVEGYFRREWNLAKRRLLDRADDAAFLMPVVVDETREADARVPEEFLRAQWSWLPGGETPPSFAKRVRQLLGADDAGSISAQSTVNRGVESRAGVAYNRNRKAPPVRLVALATIALLVLGAGVFWYDQGGSDAPAVEPTPATTSSTEAAAPHQKSIAVLPFADMSAEKNQEYMSDGIAEELLNLLAQVPDLKVIARTSSFAFKGQNIEIAEIAKKLNVTHVLEGSVRTSGKQMRITAQLVRAADSTHVWSEKYDRPADDIFAVQDEIAKAIVQALQIKLMGGTLSRREGGTDNLEAYQLYLRAGNALNESTRSSLDAAEDYLSQAIKLDPSFGKAWSRRATVVSSKQYSGHLPTTRGMELYREYTNRAIQLSPDIAEARIHLSVLHLLDNYDWPAAEREAQLAISIDPNDPLALSTLSLLAEFRGDFAGAERYQKMAIARDPQDLGLVLGLAACYSVARRHADAETLLREVIKQQPSREWTWQFLSKTLLFQDKLDAAFEALEKEPNEGARIAVRPLLLHAAGRHSEADAAMKENIERWADEWAEGVAVVYAFRGDNDRAMEWLERAYRQKDPELLSITSDPLYDGMRDDPRFKAFVRDKLKLPS